METPGWAEPAIRWLARKPVVRPLIGLLLSFGIPTVAAVYTNFRTAVRWTLADCTKLHPEGTGGLQIFHREGSKDGDLHFADSGCGANVENCYLQVKTEFDPVLINGITILAVGLVGLGFFSVGGRLFSDLRRPRGKTLSLRLHISDDQITSFTSTHRGLRTPIEGPLTIPLRMVYFFHTHDGTEIQVSDFEYEALDGHSFSPKPPFRNTVYYSGDLIWDDKSHPGPVDFQIRYKVASNFCFTKKEFTRRWQEEDATDDFIWTAKANWEEVEIIFQWPPGRPLVQGKPLVTVKPHGAAAFEKAKRCSFAVNGSNWTFTASNVEADTSYRFSWRLTDAPAQSQPSVAVKKVASAAD